MSPLFILCSYIFLFQFFFFLLFFSLPFWPQPKCLLLYLLSNEHSQMCGFESAPVLELSIRKTRWENTRYNGLKLGKICYSILWNDLAPFRLLSGALFWFSMRISPTLDAGTQILASWFWILISNTYQPEELPLLHHADCFPSIYLLFVLVLPLESLFFQILQNFLNGKSKLNHKKRNSLWKWEHVKVYNSVLKILERKNSL